MPDGARGAAGSVRAAARGGSKALADQTEGCRLRLPLHAHAHAGRPRMCGHRAAKGHSRARARLPLSGLRNVEGFAGEDMMGVSQKEPTANRPLMRRRPGPWMAKRKMPGALAGRHGRSLLIAAKMRGGYPKLQTVPPSIKPDALVALATARADCGWRPLGGGWEEKETAPRWAAMPERARCGLRVLAEGRRVSVTEEGGDVEVLSASSPLPSGAYATPPSRCSCIASVLTSV